MNKANLLIPNNNYYYLDTINSNTEFKICINNLIKYDNEDRYMIDFFSNRNNSIEIWENEHIDYIVDKFKQLSKVKNEKVYNCLKYILKDKPEFFCDGKLTSKTIEAMFIIMNILDINIKTDSIKNNKIANDNFNELIKRSEPYIKRIIQKSILLSKKIEKKYCNGVSQKTLNNEKKYKDKNKKLNKNIEFIKDMNINNYIKDSFLYDFYVFLKKSFKTLSSLDPNNNMHKIIILLFFGLIIYLLFSLFKININYNLT